MTNYYKYVLDKIEKANPMHAKKLRKSYLEIDELYKENFELFFKRYEKVLAESNLDLDYSINSYLRFCADMLNEQINFLTTGQYSNTSFDEVNRNVYNNPEVMNYHMHGLLVSQFLWLHHYKTLRFFSKEINHYAEDSKNILEVGGGHGLYTNETLLSLKQGFTFDMVDISESSISMSKALVQSNIVNYHLTDIYAFTPLVKYDFIIMGEVLEHVEDPIMLMKKLNSLGTKDAKAFITTPCNAPSIDHIYLFKNSEDVKSIFRSSGWKVLEDYEVYSENVKELHNKSITVPMLYSAFIQKQ